jgi:putative transposase
MNLDLHHHRRSIRLYGYDYSSPGLYFVTVCVQKKELLFGDIADGGVVLGQTGQEVRRIWESLPQRFGSVVLDAFIVMPNHIHGIIEIVGAPLAPPGSRREADPGSQPTLGAIVRTFKSRSAISVNRLLNRSGRRLWQRNYYEHIVRDQDELAKIREYIAENPLWWAQDRENPERQGSNDTEVSWEYPYRAQQAAPLRGIR